MTRLSIASPPLHVMAGPDPAIQPIAPRKATVRMGNTSPPDGRCPGRRREAAKAPHPPLRVDLSPQGRADPGMALPVFHLALRGRGRIASAIRVRGPWLQDFS